MKDFKIVHLKYHFSHKVLFGTQTKCFMVAQSSVTTFIWQSDKMFHISISNLIVIGTLVSVLIMIIVFSVLINDIKVDTNSKNLKTNDKSDTVTVNNKYLLNKRDNSIFDKNYEDAQRYIISHKHKRARYNEPS